MADPVLRPHSRADEGLKRGPRRATITKAGKKMGRPAILPRVGPERDKALAEALEIYSQGDTLQEVGDKFKVHPTSLRAWILSEVPEQYIPAQTKGMLQRVAEADQSIEQAKVDRDLTLLSCAREQAKFARMDLERRRPHLYGIRQEITVDHRVMVDHELSESATELLNKIRGLELPVRGTDVMLNALPQTIDGGVSPSLENDPPPSDSGPLLPPLTESK